MCWWQPEAASGNAKAFNIPSSAEAEQLLPGDGGRGAPGFVSVGSWQAEPQGREVEKAVRPRAKPSAQHLLERDLVKTNKGNFKT